MNSIVFARRRPVTTLVLVVAIVCCGLLGFSKMRPDVVPPPGTPGFTAALHRLGTSARQTRGYIAAQLASFSRTEEEPQKEAQKVVVTNPMAKTVTITEKYVCQIHSRQHIEVRALMRGYLEEIKVKEGQAVKEGDIMFTVLPTLYQARWDAELAEARLAQIDLNNTRNLFTRNVVAQPDVALHEAKLDRAKAKAKQAEAELQFSIMRAPFDGIMDRLQEQKGSLVEEGDILTTLSDNSVMWVYFNVPEARYLEYKALQGGSDPKTPQQQLKLVDSRIELVLANGETFNQPVGDFVTVEGTFNNQTGNIPFRADFPNPDRLLRHGQTGTVLLHRTLRDALVIPQRATFDILDKTYVYVVGEDHVAHQRLISYGHELEDVFVLNRGLGAADTIILEGAREVRDGDKVESEFRSPELALGNQKNHAE